jgi:hypothetical protein
MHITFESKKPMGDADVYQTELKETSFSKFDMSLIFPVLVAARSKA